MADVKICGLKTPETLEAAIEAGTRYVGFVFYADSPRYVDLNTAKTLAESVPKSVRRVGLFVDPSDQDLEKALGLVPLDILQLHGDETPERVAEIKVSTGKQVMKAIRVATKYDLEDVEAFEDAADWLLFDAKVPDDLPGGTGHSFDWGLLKGRSFQKPWMLGGGLNADNVNEALSVLTPKVVDVSSGVEISRGEKDAEKIKAFISVVKNS